MSDHFLSGEHLKALGEVTANWAMLEIGIDFIVAVTFHEFGKHPKQVEIPRSMTRKVAYLRDYASLPTLAHWKVELQELADVVSVLKETRHDAVHGAVTEHGEEGTKVIRLRYEKSFHHGSDKHITVASLLKLAVEIYATASVALNIAQALLGELKEMDD
jgi:hypothetical protein